MSETQPQTSDETLQVTAETHWWGFEIHLNEPAVKLLQQIRSYVEIGIKLLGPELALPVKIAMWVQKEWIKLVDQGNGVKLVSPWISPTMLIPFPETTKPPPVDDTSLYWTVYDPKGPGKGWSDDFRFPANYSQVGPAVASFGGRLICAHRGPGIHSELLWTIHDPDVDPDTKKGGWSRDQKLLSNTSSEPAMAELGNRLYCIYRGDTEPDLYYRYLEKWDGQWSEGESISKQHVSSKGPAVAVYDNKLLLCVHRGLDDRALYTMHDGASWSPEQLTGFRTTAKVGLAVFGGKVYCVYSIASELYWATFDGKTWESGSHISEARPWSGPAIAVFQGKLYCVYVGDNQGSLWWCTFDGAEWNFKGSIGARGNGVPALIAYRDKNGTEDQLLCVHRGRKDP